MSITRWRHAALLALTVLALWLLVAPPPGIPPETARAAGLAVFAIGAWAAGLLPEHVTAVAFFLIAMAFEVASPQTVFAGFQSAAWWLVFGGLIVGAAVQRTGLGARLARALCGRLARSYPGAVATVVIVSIGLAFLMPSTMGRLVLLMPIVLSLADHLGLAPGRRGRTGLVLATAAASYLPSTAILPANVPNAVLLGAADTLYDVQITYAPYLFLHFPVLGVLKSVVLVWLVCRMFPDEARMGADEAPPTPMTRDERRLVAILAASLVLFATDFLHGVSPAWISLAAGLACLLPGLDLVPPKAFAERVNLSALLYVAGILGLGAVVAESGLGRALSGPLLDTLQPWSGAKAYDFAVLSGLATLLGLVATMPGLPAVLSPLSGELAAATGLPLMTILMTQVVGFSTLLLPYQSPPMVVAMQIGGTGVRDGARLCLALAAITVLVLWPLDYIWWRLLGYIP